MFHYPLNYQKNTNEDAIPKRQLHVLPKSNDQFLNQSGNLLLDRLNILTPHLYQKALDNCFRPKPDSKVHQKSNQFQSAPYIDNIHHLCMDDSINIYH